MASWLGAILGPRGRTEDGERDDFFINSVQSRKLRCDNNHNDDNNNNNNKNNNIMVKMTLTTTSVLTIDLSSSQGGSDS